MIVKKVVSIGEIYKRKVWGRQAYCINLILETDTGKRVSWEFSYPRLKDLKCKNIHAGMEVTGIYITDDMSTMSIFPMTANL